MVGNLRIAVVLSVLAVAGVAHAGGARLVSGGPRGAHAGVVRALDGLRAGPLSVCWVGKRPRKVRLQIGVAADGHVLGSRALSKGAVAQCAAGVMAVQTLPHSRAQYRMVVDLATDAPAARTTESINADLADHKSALRACFDRAPRAHDGQVRLNFRIQPDGRIVDPTVAASSIGDDGATACMVRALSSARIRPAGGRIISYSLVVPLSRRATSRRASRRAAGPAPQKDGPLPADVLGRVMKASMPHFSRCEKKAKGGPVTGVVTVRFTIGADGRTRNVKVRNTTLHNRAVEACLVKVAAKLSFPAQKGRAKTRVFYPFSFHGR